MPETNDLSIEIISPEDGAVLAESPITLTGKVTHDGATVVVNTVQVRPSADGTFSTRVDLSTGPNIIPVAASWGGLRVERSITVVYAPAA